MLRRIIAFLRTPSGLLLSILIFLTWGASSPKLGKVRDQVGIGPIIIRNGSPPTIAIAAFDEAANELPAQDDLDTVVISLRHIRHEGPGLFRPWTTGRGFSLVVDATHPTPSQLELIRTANPQIQQRIDAITGWHLPVPTAPRALPPTSWQPLNVLTDVLGVVLVILPLLVALTGIPTYGRQSRRARRLAANLCPTCGYDWSATQGPCPECNTSRPALLGSPPTLPPQ